MQIAGVLLWSQTASLLLASNSINVKKTHAGKHHWLY